MLRCGRRQRLDGPDRSNRVKMKGSIKEVSSAPLRQRKIRAQGVWGNDRRPAGHHHQAAASAARQQQEIGRKRERERERERERCALVNCCVLIHRAVRPETAACETGCRLTIHLWSGDLLRVSTDAKISVRNIDGS